MVGLQKKGSSNGVPAQAYSFRFHGNRQVMAEVAVAWEASRENGGRRLPGRMPAPGCAKPSAMHTQ